MTYSLNEVEATSKRAARGAGLPWGLAEEAAKATRWLCAHDLNGCEALAALLSEIADTDISRWAPTTNNTPWTAQGGVLCPLVTGAALSDRANDVASVGVSIGRISQPVLLLPFLAMIARRTGSVVTLDGDGVAAVTDGDQIDLRGVWPDVLTSAHITTGGLIGEASALRRRADPDAKAWQALNGFAGQTYAPATEESRLKGAGAGLSDND